MTERERLCERLAAMKPSGFIGGKVTLNFEPIRLSIFCRADATAEEMSGEINQALDALERGDFEHGALDDTLIELGRRNDALLQHAEELLQRLG